MPITNIESLQRFSAKVGTDDPRWLAKSMWGYAEDERSLIALGVARLQNFARNCYK